MSLRHRSVTSSGPFAGMLSLGGLTLWSSRVENDVPGGKRVQTRMRICPARNGLSLVRASKLNRSQRRARALAALHCTAHTEE
jgi:hypothetical protein